MFRVQPTIKQIGKNQKSSESIIEVAENWADFVPLLNIKSGSKLQKFNPYPYQIILNSLVEKYSNLVILKTRQLGVTEALLSMILHKAIKNRAFCGAIFSLSDSDAKDNSTRSRLMLNSLNMPTLNDNVHELALKQGGSILFKNTNQEGSRGRACSFLYFDEAAFNRNIESIVAASTPSLTMTENASKVFVSTPGNTDNYFYNEVLQKDNGEYDILSLCREVASGNLYKGCPGLYWFETDPDTVKILIHWRAIPQYLELDQQLEEGYLKWRQRKNSLTDACLQRDHNLTFLSGEENVFNFQLVERALRGGWENHRRKGYRYIAGLDTNLMGSNWLVFTVLRENKANQELNLIAWYRNRKVSQEFNIYEISKLINKFEIDKVAIETNSGGQLYLERLTIEHPNLDLRGFDTTHISKPVMIGRLLSALERDLLIMPNEPNIKKEFLNFSKVNGGNQYEAVSGTTDIVLSLAIALQISDLSRMPERLKGFEFDEDVMEILKNGR